MSDSLERYLEQELEQERINRDARSISVQTPAGIFPSITDAAEHYGVAKQTICNWANDKDKPEFFRLKEEPKRMPVTSEMTVPANILDKMLAFMEEGDFRKARGILESFVTDNQKTEQVHVPERPRPPAREPITFMKAYEAARHLKATSYWVMSNGDLLQKGLKLPQPFHDQLIHNRAEITAFLLLPNIIEGIFKANEVTEENIDKLFMSYIEKEVHESIQKQFNQKQMDMARRCAWEKCMHHYHYLFGTRHDKGTCAGCGQSLSGEDYFVANDGNHIHQRIECVQHFAQTWITEAKEGLKKLIGQPGSKRKPPPPKQHRVVGPGGRTFDGPGEAAGYINQKLLQDWQTKNPGKTKSVNRIPGCIWPATVRGWCNDPSNTAWSWLDEPEVVGDKPLPYIPANQDKLPDHVQGTQEFLSNDDTLFISGDYTDQEIDPENRGTNWGF